MNVGRATRLWAIMAMFSLAAVLLGAAPFTAHAVRPSANTDLRLNVPFIHQYYNDPTSADCGPASVAMALDAYGKRPDSMKGDDKAFLKAVREATKVLDVHTYTGFDDLTEALSNPSFPMFHIPYTVIPKGADPVVREQNFQRIKDAVAQRKPVVMFINSNTLGRGYGGHWVVVTGFLSDQYVFVNDPDLRTRQMPNWDQRALGGQTRWPYTLFKEAADAGGEENYGIVIGDGLPDTAVMPPQLGEIGGVVRDSTGQAVPNATVILTYGQEPGAVVKTDYAGQYIFHNVPAEAATLTAIRAHTGVAIDVELGANASSQAPDLVLSDPGAQQITLPTSGLIQVNFISTGSPGDQTACTGDFGLLVPTQRTIYPNYLYYAGVPMELGASPTSSELVFYLTPQSFCAGATYLSTDGQRALILQPNNHTWIIAWEDYTDADFNDLVVRVDLQPQPLPFLSQPFASPQAASAADAFPLSLVNGFMDHQYPVNLAVPNDHWAYRVSFRGDDSQIEGDGALDAASFDGSDGTDFQLAANTATWVAAPGTVIFAGTQQISCAPKRTTMNAKVVKVQHDNGYVTEYWWLKALGTGIATGVPVTPDAGAILGYTGVNLCTNKPSLHFVVRNPYGLVVDPFGWRPQPDSTWFGIEDPWVQYNDVLGREAKSYRLWIMPDDNTQLVTPNQTTTMTSGDLRVSIEVPAYAFSEPVRIDLASAGSAANAFSQAGLMKVSGLDHPISAADLNTLQSFSLFGYTVGDEVVTTAQHDIVLNVVAPPGQLPPGIVPQIYIRSSNPFEPSRWQALTTTWDAVAGRAQASTRELGTFMLAWKTSRILVSLVRR